MPGSNRRPPRCKRGALPAELTPQARVQCRGSSGPWPPRRPRSWRARSPALNVCGSASRLRPPCSRRRILASSASSSGAGAGVSFAPALARGRRALPPARRARRCARELRVRARERLLGGAQLGELRLDPFQLVPAAAGSGFRWTGSRLALGLERALARVELGARAAPAARPRARRARARARQAALHARSSSGLDAARVVELSVARFSRRAAGGERAFATPGAASAASRAASCRSRARARPGARRAAAGLLRLGEPQADRVEPRAALLGRVELLLSLLHAGQRFGQLALALLHRRDALRERSASASPARRPPRRAAGAGLHAPTRRRRARRFDRATPSGPSGPDGTSARRRAPGALPGEPGARSRRARRSGCARARRGARPRA